MKLKKILAAVVALMCVAALLCACAPKEPAATGEEKTFTLQIVHADGSAVEKEITTTQTYLADALIDEGLLNKEEQPSDMFTVVDGEEASWDKDQAYWGFYVNGDYAVAGMNDTEIEQGAVYKLEYTLG